MSCSADRKPVDRKVVLTLSFMAGLLILVILRAHGWRLPLPLWISPSISSSPATPEDAIYAMLDAARRGDLNTYLASFSGPMHGQILQVIKEQSEASFAAYLKSQNAAFQGVAVSVIDRLTEAEARVRVEYVYRDHNEVQRVCLRKESARWRIFRIVGSEQVKTLVPYGSTATD